MGYNFKSTVLSACAIAIIFSSGFAQDYMLVCSQEKFFPASYQDLIKKIAAAESLVAENRQKEAIRLYEEIVHGSPEHLQSWKRLAQLYSWNDLPDSALKAYEKVVSLNPMDIEAKKTLAQLYIWNNRQMDAIELYEKILTFEPDNIEIHKKLAQLYSWNNFPQKAIAEYEQIARLDTTDTATMKMLANHYFWINRPLDGIRALERVVALEPDSLEYRKKLAQQYVWNNLPEKAIEQYEVILQKAPSDTAIMKTLAQQYLWNGRPEDAAPLWKKLTEIYPDSLNFKINLANSYLWSDQSARAEKPLREVLQRQPLNKDALLSLAEIERWSGKWDLAKERLRKVALIDPGNERMRKLSTDIRRNFGNFVVGKYTRLSDSNQITREVYPVTAGCFHNRFWDFRYQAGQYRVNDGKIDSTLIGYGALAQANFHPFTGTTVSLEFGAINFSSNWTPMTLRLQLSQTWRGRLTATLKLERHETQEGVRALTEKIILQGVATEFYWQVYSRWAIAGNYQVFYYSDDNRKITTTAATYLTIHQKNPNFYVYGYYLFENFDKIYPSSLPYWTPDELETQSIGLNLSHPVGRFLSLEAGYGLTRQQGINSNNYNAGIELRITNFDKLTIRFQKAGSRVYQSEYLIASFEHRF